MKTIWLGTPDIQRASLLLSQAFQDDLFLEHLLPDPVKRKRRSPKGYMCVLRYGTSYGEVHATSSNIEGVAVWLPPQAAHVSIVKMARSGALFLPFTVGPRFFLRFLDYKQHLDLLRQQHTPFPHWYLQLLGVAPQFQRQGHGSALLASMLDRLDKEGLACCLDTLNGDNVPFYERFGFKVVVESRVPKTKIGIWLMARKP
jgi:ribosomal protein S18 acetylase RimI-like enzyme